LNTLVTDCGGKTTTLCEHQVFLNVPDGAVVAADIPTITS
jgi:hypothetical protein